MKVARRPIPAACFAVLMIGWSVWFAGCSFGAKGSPPPNPRALIVTELGEIKVELDLDRAPETVGNFLRYVRGGYYPGGSFHRTVRADNQPTNQVKIGVIQAGINPTRAKEEFLPIRLERTQNTGLRHRDGALSMARDGPDTATSDFFICIGNQPELDFGGQRNPDGQGFAVFGRVIDGQSVVRKIQAAPAEGQTLTPPVKILRISLLNAGQ
jgi:peptidyl-prolyl cis-trans isomerase A (cyclophilin A)